MIRAGVIINPRSRRNREAGLAEPPSIAGVHVEVSSGRSMLDAALARLAAQQIELLVIDGGDGTVREILTRAPRHFPNAMPAIAILPSGKTNALALDLGAPRGWTLQQALASAEAGRRTRRSPIEVLRAGEAEPFVRGFLFGAAAYLRGIQMAQQTHRMGAFNDLAIALTLTAAVGRTLIGRDDRGWRAGETMRLGCDGEPGTDQNLFLLMASTLESLPMRLKPFGSGAPGLKMLTVEAPPRRLAAALGPMLWGMEADWLEAVGYRRRRPLSFDVSLGSQFILDGEAYEGGELTVRTGPPLEFVAP